MVSGSYTYTHSLVFHTIEGAERVNGTAHWSAVESPSYYFFSCGAYYNSVIIATENGQNYTIGPLVAGWHC